MIKVGIAGLGFMGRMHYKCYKALPGVQVVAICDANPSIKEDTQHAVGNIGDAQAGIDFGSFKLYADYEGMLKEAKLDAVSITLPTYLHTDFSIKAMRAGVHVLCEKPMALNVKDCKRMIAAANKSGKMLQIGHCVRFWPEYAKAKEIVDSGKYGKVIAATFQRFGSAPPWSKTIGLRRKTQRRRGIGPAHPRHRFCAVSCSACRMLFAALRPEPAPADCSHRNTISV